jgi:prolipoprotein diacylglyceryltransferase
VAPPQSLTAWAEHRGRIHGRRLLLPTTRLLGLADHTVYTALIPGAVAAVIGARLAYVVRHLGRIETPLDWLQIWNGGISLLGGIAGGPLGLTGIRRGA